MKSKSIEQLEGDYWNYEIELPSNLVIHCRKYRKIPVKDLIIEQYRYLIGPVSISNDYSKQSRSFMVAFIRAYFFDHTLAAHIKPRKRFKPSFNKVDIHDLLEGTQADLKMADRLVDEMEPRHARLPILLKKYIKQNARIIGFNIDPKFMNALDGLIVLDIQELPEEAENMYG